MYFTLKTTLLTLPKADAQKARQGYVFKENSNKDVHVLPKKNSGKLENMSDGRSRLVNLPL